MNDDPRSPARRQALKSLGRTVGAITLAPVALAASGCGGPLVDPTAVTEVPLADVPEGRSVIMHADRRVELQRSGEAIVARLLICTHEFCNLTWYAAEDNYRCTCHGGKFYPDGAPKSGPVNRPMFTLPVALDGDTVSVGPAGELSLSGPPAP